MMDEKILILDNWTELTRGLYRYILAPGACYEIHVTKWDTTTPIEIAECSLFIVGEWKEKDSNWTFERECLTAHQPMSVCLVEAARDNEENNTPIEKEQAEEDAAKFFNYGDNIIDSSTNFTENIDEGDR